jgi:hypothetical protein
MGSPGWTWTLDPAVKPFGSTVKKASKTMVESQNSSVMRFGGVTEGRKRVSPRPERAAPWLRMGWAPARGRAGA